MPMEVDKVNAEESYDEPGEEEGWYNDGHECGTNVDADYVGEVRRMCGGLVHYAHECPTPKGMGKGEHTKGQGKGHGKGKSDHYYNNGKCNGEGKGVGGECWACG